MDWQALFGVIDFSLLLAGFGGLLLAGFLKGLVGIGFTTCALPILVYSMDLATAVGLVMAPALYSCIILSVKAQDFWGVFSRFKDLHWGIAFGIALASMFVGDLNSSWAMRALGALTMIFCILSLLKPELFISETHAQRLNFVVGLANGLITGVSGSQIFPLVPYLASLKLTPEDFVQATNFSVIVGTVAMGAAMITNGTLTPSLFAISLLGIAPTMIGVVAGIRARRFLPVKAFQMIVIAVLFFLGLMLTLK